MQRPPEGQRGLAADDAERSTAPLAESPDFARLERERRLLQRVVAVAGLVPVSAGLYGILFGAGLTGDALSLAGDSHYRYLSGLLLGVGLLFWSAIPGIERRADRIGLLTLVVIAGGLGRLTGLGLGGVPGLPMLLALGMELVVTPLVCLWSLRVARRYGERARSAPARAAR